MAKERQQRGRQRLAAEDPDEAATIAQLNRLANQTALQQRSAADVERDHVAHAVERDHVAHAASDNDRTAQLSKRDAHTARERHAQGESSRGEHMHEDEATRQRDNAEAMRQRRANAAAW